ncbi:MAG: lysylphosphatidylglycerol synthase domain-containing protein [Pyrinomonadaceae bacterium]
MDERTAGQAAARKFTGAGVLFALVGLLLFAYFVWKAGPALVWAQMRALGWGFLVILLVSAARPVVRSFAWTRCFESTHALRFRHALVAYLVGDALGNLMPLGIVVSEPAKAAMARERVPLVAAASALAVENLFYMLSVALFIFAGMAALLLSFPLPPKLRLASYATLGGITCVILFGYLVVRRRWRFLSGAVEFFAARGWGRGFAGRHGPRFGAMEDRVYGFYSRHGARFVPIMLLESCFHLAGVVEVFATLYFITGSRPTWFAAFVLESVNRVINVVFKFVPMRLGVDEAGTNWFTKLFKLVGNVGVTLAIVRKVRVVVWTAVGVALLVRRGLTVRGAAREAREAARDVAEGRRQAADGSRGAAGDEPAAAPHPARNG